jgi:hypothetical protein
MRYGQWQTRLNTWATRVFGTDHLHDPVVRGKRLLEESLEFAQSIGVTEEDAQKIIAHVYSRPAGEPFQELGGVALTFYAACTSLGLEAEYVTHMELERVEAKPDAHFQKRNAQKRELFG